MSAVPNEVAVLMARIAALEAQNTDLVSQVRLFTGRMNVSKPRTDGKPGSKFYGSITLQLSHKDIAAAQARGELKVVENFAVYERVNGQTGETFYAVEATGAYRKDEAATS